MSLSIFSLMRVLTGGKFNKLHKGHMWLLKKAKKLGYLVVVIAHDRRNKRVYAVTTKQRKKALEHLGIADKVIIGSPRSFVDVVKKHKPDIIILGYDQKLPDKKTEEYVKKQKIKIVRFSKHGSYNTGKMK